MAKRRRELDFDGTTTETAEYNTVFVETSLDTHLSMLVTKSDTVSDFKKKMVWEHMQCFPKIEKIRFHSLKVKHSTNVYHLPDSMNVWSAFHGVEGIWFLFADASCTPWCHSNQNPSELDCMHMDVMINADNNCSGLSSDINRTQTLPMPMPDGITEKNEVSEMIPGFMVENPLQKTTAIRNSNNCSEENCMETDKSRAKEIKREMGCDTDDVCDNPGLKDICALYHASGTDTSIPELIVDCGKSVVEAVIKEGAEGMDLCKQQGKSTTFGTNAEVSGVWNNQSVPNKKKRRRKRAKKSAKKKLDKSGIEPKKKWRRRKNNHKKTKKLAKIEQIDIGISVRSSLLCPSTEWYPKWEDIQLKLPNSSAKEAGDKVVEGVNGDETDFAMSTQTKQALEDVDAWEREMEKTTQVRCVS